jgi:signal transduction histidine kinase
MSGRKRMFFLIVIMIVTCSIVAGASMWILYETAFEVQRQRLIETAQSQARIVEAVARFDAIYSKDYPHGTTAATLSQITDAHKNYTGFGNTGEFTLARATGDNIVFLLSHRHYDLDKLKPVRFDSELAEPMRLALSGQSGTVVGLDYRGENVLAAYEPVAELNLGIVAKIDLTEIQAPFVKAILITIGAMVLFVAGGTALFFRVFNPIIIHLEENATEQKKINKQLLKEIEARASVENELRKSRDELENRVEERTAQLRSLSKRIIVAHEEERKRIGQELHDGIAQTLSAIKYRTEAALVQAVRNKEDKDISSFEPIVTTIQGVVEELLRIIMNLRPTILDDLGLIPTISWFLREFQAIHSVIRIEKEISMQEDDVPEPLKIVIFRIIQETFNNIAKHSHANSVSLSLGNVEGIKEMVIKDNGLGFDLESVGTNELYRGLGLSSMKERAEFSGGSFSIKSQKGAGTIIRATWKA